MNISIDSDLHERTGTCCCGAIRIKNGAYGVAVFYAMIILSNLGIRLYKSNEKNQVQWNWQLLFLVSDTVAVICLVYGLVREQAAFLQPFTILSILTVSFCVLLTAFYASAVYDPTSYAGEQIEILLAGKVKTISEYFHMTTKTVITSVALICATVYCVTVIVHSWLMVTVVRCAQYFRAEQSIDYRFSAALVESYDLILRSLVYGCILGRKN